MITLREESWRNRERMKQKVAESFEGDDRGEHGRGIMWV